MTRKLARKSRQRSANQQQWEQYLAICHLCSYKHTERGSLAETSTNPSKGHLRDETSSQCWTICTRQLLDIDVSWQRRENANKCKCSQPQMDWNASQISPPWKDSALRRDVFSHHTDLSADMTIIWHNRSLSCPSGLDRLWKCRQAETPLVLGWFECSQIENIHHLFQLWDAILPSNLWNSVPRSKHWEHYVTSASNVQGSVSAYLRSLSLWEAEEAKLRLLWKGEKWLSRWPPSDLACKQHF